MVLTIGEDLEGIDLSDDQLIDAIAYVSPGIELHNYRFWFGQASIQELICSGGIHAGLVIGDTKISAKQLSFKNEQSNSFLALAGQFFNSERLVFKKREFGYSWLPS